MLTDKWRQLRSLGVTTSMDTSTKREIRILNVMSFVAAVFNITFSFWWLLLGAFQYAAINYAMSIALFGVLVLNKSKKYFLARGFFFVTILIHVATISIIFNFRSEYYLFPLIIIAAFLFQNKKLLAAFIFLTLVVYFLMAGEFFLADHAPIKEEYSPLVNFMDGMMAMMFTLFAVNQFIVLLESNRREILVKNNLLEEAVNIAKERADYSNLLLKEMNHRIKNNLQMISSLLNIHAERATSKPARIALLDAKNRIYSIALIHKQLYINENISKIDISRYIDELIPFIKESTPISKDGVIIQCACSPFSLYIEEAVTVGLIINELITNSIKHNQTLLAQLVIKINIQFNEAAEMFLSIENNGARVNEKELFASKHFGMELVSALASSYDGQVNVDENTNKISLKLNLGNNYVIKSKHRKP